MKTISKFIASSAAMLGLLAGASAHAEVFDYTLSGGQGLTDYGVGTAPGQVPYSAQLTVDTTAGTGSLVGDGGAINVSFTGNFSGFMGGSSPMNMYDIAINPASSIMYQGNSYSLVNTGAAHPDMLEFMGSSINLWAEWSAAGCNSCSLLGDTIGNISSSSGGMTSSGGTTSSGGMTSSGGTSVPEPGMVGLMGLGMVALMVRRRKAAAVFA
jgi:hypothetical protein